jgi:hypothetical protein
MVAKVARALLGVIALSSCGSSKSDEPANDQDPPRASRC